MQKINYHHGITYAENKLKEVVHVSAATHGTKYFCIFCGAEMHLHTSSLGNRFFERYSDSKQHDAFACKSIISTGTCPRFEDSGSPNKIIAQICHAPIKKGATRNASKDGNSVTIIEDSTTDDEITYVSFSSLKQMYDFLRLNRNPYESTGEYYVSDYIIHFAWMTEVFNKPNFMLGDRILQVGFWGFVKYNNRYYLIFRGYKYDTKENCISFDVRFALDTNDRTLFSSLVDKLKDSTDEKTGKRIKKQALIAGQNWTQLDTHSCCLLCQAKQGSNKECGNCRGMYVARLYSKAAVYPIPIK